VVDTGTGRITVVIRDPSRVQMRNGPSEFICGSQAPSEVTIQYTVHQAPPNADGIVRGIEFR